VSQLDGSGKHRPARRGSPLKPPPLPWRRQSTPRHACAHGGISGNGASWSHREKAAPDSGNSMGAPPPGVARMRYRHGVCRAGALCQVPAPPHLLRAGRITAGCPSILAKRLETQSQTLPASGRGRQEMDCARHGGRPPLTSHHSPRAPAQARKEAASQQPLGGSLVARGHRPHQQPRCTSQRLQRAAARYASGSVPRRWPWALLSGPSPAPPAAVPRHPGCSLVPVAHAP
jgi:hypothetical protein